MKNKKLFNFCHEQNLFAIFRLVHKNFQFHQKENTVLRSFYQIDILTLYGKFFNLNFSSNIFREMKGKHFIIKNVLRTISKKHFKS